MDLNVIVASPVWSLSGVNSFSANLVRGLRKQGVSAHILLTQLNQLDTNHIELPLDIPFEKLPVTDEDDYPKRWQAMIRYLEERTPCVYIPNSDWRHSCVSPKLSSSVGIVGIVHSDDPLHYEHVSRLGKYWNAIVSVSADVGKKTADLNPSLSQRLFTIPNGVYVPKNFHPRVINSNTPLKIIYAGRLVQHQKRIFDLPKIVEATLNLKIPIELTIVGDGSEGEQLRDISRSLVEQGKIRFLGTLPNEKVLELFEQNDIFILTSEFEGMPVSLLEAMARGCIPLVTDIASGIPELVQDGINGYRLPVGDIQMFAECLVTLYQNLNLRQEMSLNAYQTIHQGGYRIDDMVNKYIDLFNKVMHEAEAGIYKRPRNRILPPPSLKISWKNWLPISIRRVGQYGKRMLHHV